MEDRRKTFGAISFEWAIFPEFETQPLQKAFSKSDKTQLGRIILGGQAANRQRGIEVPSPDSTNHTATRFRFRDCRTNSDSVPVSSYKRSINMRLQVFPRCKLMPINSYLSRNDAISEKFTRWTLCPYRFSSGVLPLDQFGLSCDRAAGFNSKNTGARASDRQNN